MPVKKSESNSSRGITLKQRFVEAILRGELGQREGGEVIVTLKEFKAYFHDVKSQYVESFLPAATIETGQFGLTHTRFVFRERKGVYRVHCGLLVGLGVEDKS